MENKTEIIIRACDVIPAGYCAKGGEQFCKRHGIDWRDFIKNGVSAERLLACNDALVHKLIAQAELRIKGENRG